MVSRVITFYSYKGGVGRSMSMANIAVLLAQWGKKTLIIDWDLEAPGLESFYSNYINIDAVKRKTGLIDLLNLKLSNPTVKAEQINWDDFISTIHIDKTTGLDIITAGRRDENFVSNVKKFDYNNFYQESDGGEYLEELREFWLDHYDFILIDSRTGLTDSSGICSIHMPDILVLLFTLNEQSFHGIKTVAEKAIKGQKQIVFDRFKLRTIPIPSRIENQETALLDEWMTRIYSSSDAMLEWLPKKGENLNIQSVTAAQLMNLIKIPYRTYYAFGEKLAVVERGTADHQDIGYTYETIAAVLVNDFQNIELLVDSRDEYVKKAKGEDYSDNSDFRKIIEKEKEEKMKVEEDLTRKVERAKKKNNVFRIIVAALIIGIITIALIGIYFDRSPVVQEIVQTDSLKQKEAYLAFKSAYVNLDSNQFDLKTNINLIQQYYKLDKQYQDSASDTKQKIEIVITYKFANILKNYYDSLKVKNKNATTDFADTISVFGSLSNITSAVLQKKIDSLRLENRITNRISDSAQIDYKSDSLGMSVTFIESGNFLIDKMQEVKGMENSVTVNFSYDFKIRSFTYTTLKGFPVSGVVQKTVIELFFCSSGNVYINNNAGNIVSALRANKTYNVIVRNNYKAPSDTTSPYYGVDNQIRYNGEAERKIANSVRDIIFKESRIRLNPTPARTPTRDYLSIFICINDPKMKY